MGQMRSANNGLYRQLFAGISGTVSKYKYFVFKCSNLKGQCPIFYRVKIMVVYSNSIYFETLILFD